jgi:hypothetical protein
MKIRVITIALLIALAAALSACQKDEGPMEKMGKKMDEAADEVQEAADDVGDEIEEAAEEVKDAVDGDG